MREILRSAVALFEKNQISAVDAEILLAHVIGVSRKQLITSTWELPESELERVQDEFNGLVEQRLLGKPVQYITGSAPFRYLELSVGPGVLIPRPETEELVQLVLDDYNNKKDTTESSKILSILDIGTGSGCIATALKINLTNSIIHAVDISEGALKVAKRNALQYKADINFIEIDFLNETTWEQLPKVDIIISNPPYIPIEEKKILDKNVTEYEPHQALFVSDSSPFIFYEKIAAFGKSHLLPNGKIFVEVHEDFAKQTASIFELDYQVIIKKDIFGKDRMLLINRK